MAVRRVDLDSGLRGPGQSSGRRRLRHDARTCGESTSKTPKKSHVLVRNLDLLLTRSCDDSTPSMNPAKRSLPTTRRLRRIFIGGNYDLMADLREIQHMIHPSFETVLAYDYEVLPSKIHDTDIKLLSKCGYALFECTSPAGQLMELERTADFDVQAFVVYQVRRTGDPPPDYISSMITTMDIPLFGYSKFRELRKYLGGIFPNIEDNRPRTMLQILRNSYLPEGYRQVVLAEIERAIRRH